MDSSQSTSWREPWRLLSIGAKLGGPALARLLLDQAGFMAVFGFTVWLSNSLCIALALPLLLAGVGALFWWVDRRAEIVEAMWKWAMEND